MMLFTIPHAKLNEGAGYDLGAIEFFPVLEAASRARSVQYEVVVGNTNREFVDLNRREAESTDFLNEVRKHLKTAILHLDVHSYPYMDTGVTDEEAMTDHDYDLREWGLNDIILFNIPEVTDQTLLDQIDNTLQEHGIDVGIEQGGFENYLTLVANTLFDVPSVLMELNENSVQLYPVIAAQVVEALQVYAEGKTGTAEESEVPS